MNIMGQIEDNLKKLQSADLKLQWEAVDYFTFTKSTMAIEPLIGLFGSVNAPLANKAGKAVVGIGQAAVPLLINALKSESVSTRWIACDALIDIGDERAIDHILSLFEDENMDIAMKAAKEVVEFEHLDFSKLEDLADSPKKKVRLCVIESMRKSGNRKGIKCIAGMVSDEEEIRSKAIEALGSFGEDGIPTLARILANGDEGLCLDALDSLSAIGEAALAQAVEAMAHKSDSVRKAAIHVIERILDDADSIKVLDMGKTRAALYKFVDLSSEKEDARRRVGKIYFEIARLQGFNREKLKLLKPEKKTDGRFRMCTL